MTLTDVAPYLLVGFILLVNIALWSSLSGKKSQRQMDMWQKVTKTMQKPWEIEDKNLKELSERVKNLRQKSSSTTDDENND
jgi:hypothetical protein